MSQSLLRRHRHLHVLLFRQLVITPLALWRGVGGEASMILQPYMVQGERDGVQCFFTLRWFQLALPYRDTMPAHLCQPPLFFPIPFLVPANLRHPELPVRLRNLTALRVHNVITPLALWRGAGGEAHIVSMPKTPVYENTCAILTKHQVRMSRQALVI